MAKISTYPNTSPISGDDKVIGTDSSNDDQTKNFKLSEISAYVIGNIPVTPIINIGTQDLTITDQVRVLSLQGTSANDVVSIGELNVNGQGSIYNTSTLNSTHYGLNAGLNSTGNRQTAVGISAGKDNTGSEQIVYGHVAGELNSAANQIAIGYYAGYDNSGANQTTLGYFAGALQSGTENISLGTQASRSNTGNSVISIGANSCFGNTGENIVAIGNNTGRSNTGNENTFIGYDAGYYTSNGTTVANDVSDSVFIGARTKSNGSNQENQIVIGADATGLGNDSVVIGNDNINVTVLKGDIGLGTTTPSEKLDVVGNIKLSETAATVDTDKFVVLDNGVIKYRTGDEVLADIGASDLLPNPTNARLPFNDNGSFSDSNITNSANGIAVSGKISLNDGSFNVSLGELSLNALTTGGSNVALGCFSGQNNTTGFENTSIGGESFLFNNIGSGNTCVGFGSGSYLNSGSFNQELNNSVFIGAFSRSLSSGSSNEIVIGHNAFGNGSNTVTLGNNNIVLTVLKGVVNMSGVPTSPTGLNSGDIWSDSGTLKIV